ncbi:MAG: arginase family protein [bacterium]
MSGVVAMAFFLRAIREHSMRFSRGGTGYYDPEARREFLEHEMAEGRIVDVGDADILPTNVIDTFHNITGMTRKLLEQGAMPVVLGGDHAISFPIVRAFSEPLHMVHCDAHLDYAPFIHGLEYTNAHAFRHITRLPHVQSLTQVGIRSLRNTRDMMEDSLRREPRGDDGGVPGRPLPGDRREGPSKRSLLRQPRHRRARPASRARLRVGRA